MGSTVFDSVLFRDMFGTAEMRAIFADEALVGRYVEAEVALARAQARLGVVPEAAAFKVALACRTPVGHYSPKSRAANLTAELGKEILERIANTVPQRSVA